MIVTQWVNIPEKAINKPRQVGLGGAKYLQSISPWDLPHNFRLKIEDQKLTIEWKYLSDSEPVKKNNFPNGLCVEMGKHSARLYKIAIPIELLERTISEMPQDQASTATEALAKMKSLLSEIESYTNEGNKEAVTKTAGWWQEQTNKSELLSASF